MSQSRAVRSQAPSGRSRVGMTIGARAGAPIGASGGAGAIRSGTIGCGAAMAAASRGVGANRSGAIWRGGGASWACAAANNEQPAKPSRSASRIEAFVQSKGVLLPLLANRGRAAKVAKIGDARNFGDLGALHHRGSCDCPSGDEFRPRLLALIRRAGVGRRQGRTRERESAVAPKRTNPIGQGDVALAAKANVLCARSARRSRASKTTTGPSAR